MARRNERRVSRGKTTASGSLPSTASISSSANAVRAPVPLDRRLHTYRVPRRTDWEASITACSKGRCSNAWSVLW